MLEPLVVIWQSLLKAFPEFENNPFWATLAQPELGGLVWRTATQGVSESMAVAAGSGRLA